MFMHFLKTFLHTRKGPAGTANGKLVASK